MKIQFDPNLEYQQEAIKSVTDIFEGQEIYSNNFSVPSFDSQGLYTNETELGYGNKLHLLDDEILKNLNKIQLRNGLEHSKMPANNKLGRDFTVEMETGTGKTYVYLKAIFEMHKLYGFTKFIIVVPSIAIKEGVNKSLEITEEHFKVAFDNTPYDYFTYNSSNLEQVRSFATNDYIQIMVINIDAFRRSFSDLDKETKANIIHRTNDRLSGFKPIEFIQSTNPIVIIDEPQSVDTTPKSKEAIESLNPLCTIRYSATHREKHHMIYKLDPIDAYNKQLVKQIEVAEFQVEDNSNQAYIKLVSVDNKKSPITAKIEIDVMKSGSVSRSTIIVKQGEDLFERSGGRDIYSGYIINDIYCESGAEYIDFTSKPEILELGQATGGVDTDALKRLQIRKTIEEHLEKELKLTRRGIKVLSLFFIDKVANYRSYDEEGNILKGKYALMFEEEYRSLIRKPKYRTLFEDVDVDTIVSEVHNGYFSIDKKGKVKDTSGATQDDEDTYSLIMKDKERLLSLDNKLKFIFSHSALREGWDNPNIFQICTLNESNSVIKKRQEIGRGLRLCVNQDGERVFGFEVNTLTVMANESYEEFAKKLQKEIEDDTGIKFGLIEEHSFANLVIFDEKGEEHYLGIEKSENLWKHLKERDYIDTKGKIQDSLKMDLRGNCVVLPDGYEAVSSQIISLLKKVAGNLNIKDANNRRILTLNKEVYLSEEFTELWNRIKHKTTYRVKFSESILIEACAREIRDHLVVGKSRFHYIKAEIGVTQGGVDAQVKEELNYVYDAKDFELPDIISYLQNETNLTRKAIVEILIKSGKLEQFKNNPQKFIEQTISMIQRTMRKFVVDGIKYEKIGNDVYYAQEIFEEQELAGYLNQNLVESNRGVYDYVIYDSDIEKNFAISFEKNPSVKVYAKLPSFFKIDTPLGSYNPDWAVLIEKDDEEKLYFVVESKGSLFTDDLRPAEQAKIDCGTAHFKALDSDVKFIKATGMKDVEAYI
ncbi:MAG: DEAD/DEAH box helicase family protein [Bacteroidales bacterium]|nr:DEAD/DEAH box helicase family protein [Bacteroidales bacterium]